MLRYSDELSCDNIYDTLSIIEMRASHVEKSNYIFVERGKETVRIINYFSLTVFEVPYQLWNRIDDWVKYDLELVEKLVANGILVQKYKEENYLEYIYNSRFLKIIIS